MSNIHGSDIVIGLWVAENPELAAIIMVALFLMGLGLGVAFEARSHE